MKTIRSTFAVFGIAAAVAASGMFISEPAAAATRLAPSHFVGSAVIGRNALAAKPLATWSQAGAAALNHPWGMALDAGGNLWVANQGANQILKYDSSLVQHTGRTITAGISQPSAVAFDSKGNLYVANQGTSSITEYNPSTLAQIPSRTLAYGISAPKWLAIDGVDDIWVNNGFQSVNVYSADETFIKTLPLSHPGPIAVHGGFLDIGSGTAELNMVLQQELVSNNQIGTFYMGSEIIGSCYDANGNNYYTDAGADDILFTNHTLNVTSVFAASPPAPFLPSGVAADIAHNHIFVSSWSTSQIAVYTTQGALLTIIH
jgi:sugar lactone lactonase YvrE